MKSIKYLFVLLLLLQQYSFGEYVETSKIKILIKEMEEANINKENNVDENQKALERIRKEINLNTELKNKETADASIGQYNSENLNERISSLISFYKKTESNEEYIYQDSFTYQEVCLNGKCTTSALVDAKIFKEKMDLLKKNKGDKSEIIAKLYNVNPLATRANLLEQFENTVYKADDGNSSLMQSSNEINESEDKKYIEIENNQKFFDITVFVAPTFLTLKRK